MPEHNASSTNASPWQRELAQTLPFRTNEMLLELQALRQAINALRQDLFPTPSIILTGTSVLAEYTRLLESK